MSALCTLIGGLGSHRRPVSRKQRPITLHIRDLRRGERREEAVRELCDRYSEELVRYAAKTLRALRATRRSADEEDAALQAFSKVCRGIEHGQLDVGDRDALRKLLLWSARGEAITQRKRSGWRIWRVLADLRRVWATRRGNDETGTPFRQRDSSMFGLAKRFGLRPRSSRGQTRRPRSLRAAIEVVEDRALLSTLSAITGGEYADEDPGPQESDVFGIGGDNHAYISREGGPWNSLGGDVKQISVGLGPYDAPLTKLYGIGSDDKVWYIYPVQKGSGYETRWYPLGGGTVKEISATTDNTVFVINSNNSVSVHDGTGWHLLGGYVTQISATFVHDFHGITHPEVFGIGRDDKVWVNRDDGKGWQPLGGGTVKEISAAGEDTVFAINSNNSVSVHDIKTGWHPLGGYAKQISATLFTGNGSYQPEVFAIGSDNSVWVNRDDGKGWHGLGGYALEIAAPALDAGHHLYDEVFTIGGSHEGHWIQGGHWHNLGGWLKV